MGQLDSMYSAVQDCISVSSFDVSDAIHAVAIVALSFAKPAGQRVHDCKLITYLARTTSFKTLHNHTYDANSSDEDLLRQSCTGMWGSGGSRDPYIEGQSISYLRPCCQIGWLPFCKRLHAPSILVQETYTFLLH